MRLREVLVDIATTGNNEPSWMKDVGKKLIPTEWELIKNDPSKFSSTWDFEVSTRNDETIFWPVSEAAMAWAHTKFGDIDRISRVKDGEDQHGYILDTKAAAWPLHMASKDCLLSEDDYRECMEESHRLQWER